MFEMLASPFAKKAKSGAGSNGLRVALIPGNVGDHACRPAPRSKRLNVSGVGSRLVLGLSVRVKRWPESVRAS